MTTLGDCSYWSDGDRTIVNARCEDVLPTLGDESFDIVVTSPPYNMGSGTTLRAAADAGIVGLGIEREQRFCSLAVTRLAQGALDFTAAGSGSYPLPENDR